MGEHRKALISHSPSLVLAASISLLRVWWSKWKASRTVTSKLELRSEEEKEKRRGGSEEDFYEML